MRPLESMSEVALTEMREQLGELVNRAAYKDERIVLTRHGKAVAALVPVALLPELEVSWCAAYASE